MHCSLTSFFWSLPICQDIHTSQHAVARHWFNEGGVRWFTGVWCGSPFCLKCRYGMIVMYNCLSCLGTVFVVGFLVFFFFFGSYGHNWYYAIPLVDRLQLSFRYLLQIFLSTRWAILLNLHVEMFRVNKYPIYITIIVCYIDYCWNFYTWDEMIFLVW